jgi:type II secretory pathway pseudopilin PulG
MNNNMVPAGCGTRLEAKETPRKKEIVMKSVIAIVALATLVATPVLAQTKHRQPQQAQQAQTQQTYTQFRSTNQRHSDNPAYDVYDSDGQYIGSDPDVTVRERMRTELHEQQ